MNKYKYETRKEAMQEINDITENGMVYRDDVEEILLAKKEPKNHFSDVSKMVGKVEKCECNCHKYGVKGGLKLECKKCDCVYLGDDKGFKPKESWMCDACGIDHLAKAHEMMDKEELEVEELETTMFDGQWAFKGNTQTEIEKLNQLIKAHNALATKVTNLVKEK